jgi:predicted MFS family arabinose efflux permease
MLGLAGLIVMADNWVVSPILPTIAQNLDTDVTRAGILIAAYMLPFGLFQLVFGPLADRFGKLRTIQVTLAVFAVVTATGGLMSSLTGLMVVRAVTGVFAASTMPVSLALIGDVVPLQHRQQAIGTFMGIAFLGQGISMALGGSIAFALGWRWVFFLYGAIAAVVVVVLVLGTRGLQTPQLSRGPVLAPYRLLLGRWRSVRVYLIVLVEGILILGLFSFLGALLAERNGLGVLGVGLVLTAFGVAAVVFGRTSGRLAARLGRTNLIALALLVGAGSALLMYSVDYLPFEILAIFGLGAAFMSAHSSLLTLATEFAAQHRGVAMSLVAFAFMGGGALGTTLAAGVIRSGGYGVFLLMWSIGLAVLGLASWFVLGRQTGLRAARQAVRENEA